MQLPEQYIESMKKLLGASELADYMASFDEPRHYGLRVNTSKISAADFLKISPFELSPVSWTKNGFYYSGEDKPAKHPYYFAGLYYLQEPSAMTPAEVLPVCEGDKVLDLCAAPGGKSTELGARLNGTGLLVSNDISASRAKALLKNIELFGIQNALVTCEYPERLASVFPDFFDKILVDAPCSGEGMFRKDAKLIKSWESQGPEYFAPIQRGILESAAKMLKAGGYMVYSTCTFSREEDEDSIRHFLDGHPEFELEKIPGHEGFARAFDMEEAVRLFPHRLKGEGHFVALLRKNKSAACGEHSQTESLAAGGTAAAKARLPYELEEFLEEFKAPVDRASITVMGERVYAVPAASRSIKGLRIMRNGLLMGELKKNRFEPSQALAMALKCGECSTVADLKSGGANAVKYLKGETIELAKEDLRGCGRNVLVAADGFPLGWGRLNGLTVKNRYLPGWRWM
ncbi:MAG: RsmB/NOP family class I SAM-dependent RNA methyltransferase [Butyrivibrio sp.]|nr:RsmB/NOP family class I SAM-dependent RNA methyltransferase [Butyrivibrio sp.]